MVTTQEVVLWFLLFATGGWLLAKSFTRILALAISLATGNTVQFRLLGLLKVKDVAIKFKKGRFESIFIHDLRGNFSQSLHPRLLLSPSKFKLHFYLRDVEIVLRPSPPSSKKVGASRKKKTVSSPSRGKWRLLTSLARLINMSASDIVVRSVQVAEIWLHVREIELGTSNEGHSSGILGIQLDTTAANIVLRDESGSGNVLFGLGLFKRSETKELSPLLALEHLNVDLKLDCLRDVGLVLKTANVICGLIDLNLTEQLLEVKSISSQNKSKVSSISPETSLEGVEETVCEGDVKVYKEFPPQKVPVKVQFSLSAIKIRCSHARDQVVMEHEILGLWLESVRTDLKLDLNAGCGGVKVLRGFGGCLFEIVTIASHMSVEFPALSQDPIQAEGNVTVTGVHAKLEPNNFDPWIKIFSEERRKREPTEVDKHVLPERDTQKKKEKSKSKKMNIILALDVTIPDFRLEAFNERTDCLYKVLARKANFYVKSGVIGNSLQAQTEFCDLQIQILDSEVGELGTGLQNLEVPVLGEGGDRSNSCGIGESGLFENEEKWISLFEIKRLGAEWGLAGPDEGEEWGVARDLPGHKKMTLQLGISGCHLLLCFGKVDTLLSHVTSVQKYLRKIPKKGKSNKSKKSGAQKGQNRKALDRLKVVCNGFVLEMVEKTKVVEVDIPDPKKVNFGNQGGEVVFSTTPDGNPRIAEIRRALFEGKSMAEMEVKMKLELTKVTVSSDLEDFSVRGRLEKCSLVYIEQSLNGETLAESVLIGVRMGWLVYHKGMKEERIPGSILFTAQGLETRWEPDAHLFLQDMNRKFRKAMSERKGKMAEVVAGQVEDKNKSKSEEEVVSTANLLNRQDEGLRNRIEGEGEGQGMTGNMEDYAETREVDETRIEEPSSSSVPKKEKSELLIAIDFEDIRCTAMVADGVEAHLNVQSAFSEDIKVGVLLEMLDSGFNGVDIIRSKSLQVSRVPAVVENLNSSPSSDKLKDMERGGWSGEIRRDEELKSVWDVVVLGQGVDVIIPYKMELRGIEDAIDNMLRALKLVTASQNLGNAKKKVGNKAVSRKGAIRLNVQNLRIEIEDEPMQAWLDTHLRIMKNLGQEFLVRERFLTERKVEALVKKSETLGGSRRVSKEYEENEGGGGVGWSSGGSFSENGDKNLDESAFKEAWEKLHQKQFDLYKAEVEKLTKYQGSGATREGFQSGFSLYETRRSLMSVTFSSLEVVLTPIEGGREGMVERVRSLDEVDPSENIPFSRLYGREIEFSCTGLKWVLRDYPHSLLSASEGRFKGVAIMAAQATIYQPQQKTDVFVGRWRKVTVLRSISGSTPPLKLYSDSVFEFQVGEISYGVGFEPSLYNDLSHAISTAIRKADFGRQKGVSDSILLSSNLQKAAVPHEALSDPPLLKTNVVVSSQSESLKNIKNENGHFEKKTSPLIAPKERSLPWWDIMRYYVHGKTKIQINECDCYFLATVNPYEQKDLLHINSSSLVYTETKGNILLRYEDVEVRVASSLETERSKNRLSGPQIDRTLVIESPVFEMQITLGWECPSGFPNMHYLHALPEEKKLRKPLYDPFRSDGLNMSWEWRFTTKNEDQETPTVENSLSKSSERRSGRNQLGPNFENEGSFSSRAQRVVPTVNLRGQDLSWILRFYQLMYYPPHKLRSFGRAKQFGVPKRPRSGNFSLSQTLSEMLIRIDVSPGCLKRHEFFDFDDGEDELVWNMDGCKYELCWGRNLRAWDGIEKRPSLLTVYQGLDIARLQVNLDDNLYEVGLTDEDLQSKMSRIGVLEELLEVSENIKMKEAKEKGRAEKLEKRGDKGFVLFTDFVALHKQSLKADRLQLGIWKVGRKYWEGRWENEEPLPLERTDQEDLLLSEVIEEEGVTENCWRVLVYGLKVLWTIPNRDAIWAWVADMSGVSSKKPSPSRQRAGRKKMEELQRIKLEEETHLDKQTKNLEVEEKKEEKVTETDIIAKAVAEEPSTKFIISIIQPQFNLHSEEAKGRFLLAAASGQLLARTFHSLVSTGIELLTHSMLTKEELSRLGETSLITWKKHELSVLLEHVQAHVALTDIDPTARIQWLPKIPTGDLGFREEVQNDSRSLLRRVFQPCAMYFQCARHKGGVDGAKTKPLTEISFNSPNITAAMDSRQFQILVDVISNLILARLPKKRKNKEALDEGEGEEDEVAEVVPEGIEEVELAKIEVEKAERGARVLFGDIEHIQERCNSDNLTFQSEAAGLGFSREGRLWMLSCGKHMLITRLEVELRSGRRVRQLAYNDLRGIVHIFAQKHQEKQKTPGAAMAISWAIDKIVWTLVEGEAFAEAELSRMILNVDRDFNDVGMAQFVVKAVVLRNLMSNTKSDTVLAAWNPPTDWGRNSMINVVGKSGAPVDGVAPIQSFEVELYPLKIHLTDAMYSKTWQYLFPRDLDPQVGQEAYRPTTSKRIQRKKTTVIPAKTDFEFVTPLMPTVSSGPTEFSGNENLGIGQEEQTNRQIHVVSSSGPQHKSGPLNLSDYEHFSDSESDFLIPRSVSSPSYYNDFLSSTNSPEQNPGLETFFRSKFTGVGTVHTSRHVESVKSPQSSPLLGIGDGPNSGATRVSSGNIDASQLKAKEGEEGNWRMGAKSGKQEKKFAKVDEREREREREVNDKQGKKLAKEEEREREREIKKAAKGKEKLEEKELKKAKMAARLDEKSLKQKEKIERKRGEARMEKERAEKKGKSSLYIKNIKISRVELLVTYIGARYSVSDLRLLTDTFARSEYTGTWRKLFGKIKKHVIWGVLKSVAGMQGSKFTDRSQPTLVPQSEEESESESETGSEVSSVGSLPTHHVHPGVIMKRIQKQSDRAGEGFVSSIRGIFNSQKRKMKASIRRTLAEGSDGEGGSSSVSGKDGSGGGGGAISKTKGFLTRKTSIMMSRLPSGRHKGKSETENPLSPPRELFGTPEEKLYDNTGNDLGSYKSNKH